jgi:ATP-dependent exoDNAse (exonuclease V) beta subunit
MRGLIDTWHAYKRAAALLDFDDLLYTARDLLAQHADVREALAKRFQYVMVDEFQDTDPLQIEILWRICGEHSKGADGDPLKRTLRPGALFLVGDPKQAIYRFRGADVNAYIGARKAIGQSALLNITTNFRSLEPILDFVNRGFEPVLSEAAGQPGFSKLAPLHKAAKGMTPVVALDIEINGDKPSASTIRDAEATHVAELCSRLVGNFEVRDHVTNKLRPCRYGDIALLAPVGTDLWRFEEALEDRGIPVSTQAGKGFFRRQEIQDLIALTRALADPRDTLALGALMRGPLVGLSEAELLDIADALPVDPTHPDRLPTLGLWTDPSHVPHDLARSVLEALQSLRKRANATTPHALLSDAVCALHVQPHLRQRFKAGAERAIANVDLFLEMSRAYDVRGLRAFARDMRANWEEATRQVEGRPDSEAESVSLITIHASKGLEWPVVIPINMTGSPRSESGLMQDRRTNVFSIPILGVEPAGYDAIKSWNEQEHARERVRLWYVAATRARDLLVLPRYSIDLPDRAWARVVDLGLAGLKALVPQDLGDESQSATEARENNQTHAQFAADASRISDNQKPINWLRPSRAEESATFNIEPEPIHEDLEESADATEIPVPAIAGSSTRGTILHKLMEEVLLGETADDTTELEKRAGELLVQLGIEPAADPKIGLSPIELAAAITRTLAMPEVRELRPRLVPEHTVFGQQTSPDGDTLLSGIADAVAVDNDGAIDVVIDWKSDVDPAPSAIIHYRNQIGEYQRRVGAKRALIVMMTAGHIIGTR